MTRLANDNYLSVNLSLPSVKLLCMSERWAHRCMQRLVLAAGSAHFMPHPHLHPHPHPQHGPMPPGEPTKCDQLQQPLVGLEA